MPDTKNGFKAGTDMEVTDQRSDATKATRPLSRNTKEDSQMSINEMDSKVKELRELRRMAEELAGEIDALQDTIKAEMTASGAEEAQGVDWKITWKNVQSKRFDKAAMVAMFGQDCYDKFCKTVSSRRFVIA